VKRWTDKSIKTAEGRGFSSPKAMKQSKMAINNDKLRMMENLRLYLLFAKLQPSPVGLRLDKGAWRFQSIESFNSVTEEIRQNENYGNYKIYVKHACTTHAWQRQQTMTEEC